MKITLQNLLNLSDNDIKRAKVKLNQESRGAHATSNPVQIYLSNPEEVNTDWLFWHKKTRYFKKGWLAVCLLRLDYDRWLFTTIKEVTEELPVADKIYGGIGYKGHEIEKYSNFYGRVIVKYHKDHQGQGVWYENIIDELEVLEILPSLFDGEAFPGYDKVRLTYRQLATIIDKGKRDWIAALENQKAVYLIADTSNGRLYVGSATGDNGMLLQRWSNYVHSGHGGNQELIGFDFDDIKQNFQYSILENYNARVDKGFILDRETWWKITLQTRKFGYNKN
ncbi:MAG: GIY-YIG nuclease family protein [Firmicutes bacterium]|nr:GIY-YIG nuclease family protein [Bacillota bacterium]